MANPMGWERYVGDHGTVIGINSFGASGKGSLLMEKFGFTVDHVVTAAKRIVASQR
jgi:transketolase